MKIDQPVTLKIPRPLYNKLQQLIIGTSFRSVTEFVIYVLRDLASAEGAPTKPEAKDTAQLTDKEIALIRDRLKNLGYL